MIYELANPELICALSSETANEWIYLMLPNQRRTYARNRCPDVLAQKGKKRDMIATDFSAKEPALGYYYQVRYSLYLLLGHEDNDDMELSLEGLDDIVLKDKDSVNLCQTKLHIKSVANLTNASPDLWKTILVWSEAIADKLVDSEKTLFTLITTAKAGKSSVTYEMCKASGLRDNDLILKTLEETVNSSESKTNKKAYAAFDKLTTVQKNELIENIQILDASLDMEQVKQKTMNKLRLWVAPDKRHPFYERLEGWWFTKCIENLFDNAPNITFRELQAAIWDILDQFRSDNLPVDFTEKIVVEDEALREDNRTCCNTIKTCFCWKVFDEKCDK